LSGLKELNQIATLYDPQELVRNQCVYGRPQKLFQAGATSNFSLIPFQVADDAMQMDVHKTLYSFYPVSLC